MKKLKALAAAFLVVFSMFSTSSDNANSHPEKKQNILLVSGPEINVSDNFSTEDIIKNLQKKQANVSSIGDGISDITSKEIVDAIAAQPENSLVFFFMHGTVDSEGRHELKGFKGFDVTPIKSADLFDDIKDALGDRKSVDLFIVSCHGGAMIKDVDRLPANSRIIALSDFEQETSFSEITNLFNAISESNDPLTMENMLYTYLTQTVNQDLNPSFGVSGGVKFSLGELTVQHVGKTKISNQLLKEELGNYMSDEEINAITTKISGEYNWGSIFSSDDGRFTWVANPKYGGKVPDIVFKDFGERGKAFAVVFANYLVGQKQTLKPER